jgi:hypothetical protein
MEARDPAEAVLYAGPWLWLAYRIREADADGLFAVVGYSGVEEHQMGLRVDERLREHPLHRRGLEPYAFHEVFEALPDANAPRRWAVTFRSDVLDVTATGFETASHRVKATSGWAALRAVVPDRI